MFDSIGNIVPKLQMMCQWSRMRFMGHKKKHKNKIRMTIVDSPIKSEPENFFRKDLLKTIVIISLLLLFQTAIYFLTKNSLF